MLAGALSRLCVARLIEEVVDGRAQELVGNEAVRRDARLFACRACVVLRFQ